MLQTIIRSARLLDRKETVQLVAFTLLRILLNILDLVGIVLIGLVGAVLSGSALEPLLEEFLPSNRNEMVLVLLGAALLLFLLKMVLGAILSRATWRFLAFVEAKFSQQISNSIFLAGLATVRKYSKEELEWAILRSSSVAFPNVLGQAVILLGELSLTLIIFLLLLASDPISALAVTAYFGVIVIGFQAISQRALSRAGQKFSAASVSVAESLSDLSSSYREIYSLSKLEIFLKRLNEARQKASNASALNSHLGALPRLIAELGLIVGALFFVAFQMVTSSGNLNFATIGIFLMGSLRMMSALLPIQRALMALRFDGPVASSAQDFLEALSQEQVDCETPANLPLEFRRQGLQEGVQISLESITHTQAQNGEQPTLLDISLSINPGCRVGIIGPSGSGKTTLLEVLTGILIPDSGLITLNGLRPEKFRQEFPEGIAYVPQKPGLIAGSILENIALGVLPDLVDRQRVREILEQLGLLELVDSLPQGMSTLISRTNPPFSGGQIQRLGIARALYFSPTVLILDEATSALDSAAETLVLSAVSKLPEYCTVISVAHSLSTLKNSDVIFLLVEGRVIASGSLLDLKKTQPFVRSYLDKIHLESDASKDP